MWKDSGANVVLIEMDIGYIDVTLDDVESDVDSVKTKVAGEQV